MPLNQASTGAEEPSPPVPLPVAPLPPDGALAKAVVAVERFCTAYARALGVFGTGISVVCAVVHEPGGPRRRVVRLDPPRIASFAGSNAPALLTVAINPAADGWDLPFPDAGGNPADAIVASKWIGTRGPCHDKLWHLVHLAAFTEDALVETGALLTAEQSRTVYIEALTADLTGTLLRTLVGELANPARLEFTHSPIPATDARVQGTAGTRAKYPGKPVCNNPK